MLYLMLVVSVLIIYFGIWDLGLPLFSCGFQSGKEERWFWVNLHFLDDRDVLQDRFCLVSGVYPVLVNVKPAGIAKIAD